MSSPQYQIEAFPCLSQERIRVACFKVEGDRADDLVALDISLPIMTPTTIEIDRHGQVRKLIWRI